MKPTALFLSGSLLGVCITVGVFYLRGPVYQQFLARRAAPAQDARALAPIRSGERFMGSAGAPVTIIEYSDFQCPYCAMFRSEIFPKIKAGYIDSGKVRFIHRNLPLSSHSQAMPAAHAVACAGDQGKDWELSHLLFTRTSCLECQGVMELSKALPLDRKQFEQCVSQNTHQASIDQDIASARQMQFDGTPSFVIGRTTPEGVEGIALSGALPYEEFAARIDRLLAGRAE